MGCGLNSDRSADWLRGIIDWATLERLLRVNATSSVEAIAPRKFRAFFLAVVTQAQPLGAKTGHSLRCQAGPGVIVRFDAFVSSRRRSRAVPDRAPPDAGECVWNDSIGQAFAVVGTVLVLFY
jgi:hypothetical protein